MAGDEPGRGPADHAQVYIAHCDRQRRFKFVNRAYAARFGLEPDAVVGKTVPEVLGEAAYETFRRYVDRVLAGEAVDYEVEVPYERLGRRVMHCTYEPERDAAGAVVGWFAVVTDVTERGRTARALLESEQRFTRFMEHLPGLAWIKDAGGRYVYANDAAVRAFRRTRDQLYGRTDDEVFPAETAERFRDNDARALASPSGVQLVEALEHDDGVHYSLVTKFAIPGADGAPPLVGGMAIDVTDVKRAEEARRASDERFRGLMEQAPFSIQIFAPDGRTVLVNRAWEELWGVTLDQVASYNILQDAQLEAKGILPLLRRAFAGAPVELPAIAYDPNETIPDRTRHKDPVRWVAAVAYPLKDSDGRVREVALIHEDITARRRAEDALRDSERLYRAIGESIDYGVWVCDPEGRNTYASESFLRLVGLTQQECSEFGWGKVLHPDDAERTVAAWKECVRAGGQWDIEHRFKGVDGRWHHVLARGVPVRNERGEATAWAGINLDITRLKQAEDELREADKRKDEFLAMLAHELRNPLAPIRNALHILKQPAATGPVLRDARDMAERQVQHMARLLDDLLDVSRISRGRIELRREPVDVAAVIRRSVEAVRPLVEERRHELAVALPAGPLRVDADPARLEQVLANLLNNAAKYTDPGGRIAVNAGREGAEAVIRVRDTGVGIAPEMRAKIFELFVQAERRIDRSRGGVGIGLTLVKKLVELHGGRVEALSEGPGRGSEFVVHFPALPDANPGGRECRADADGVADLPPRRVLVVDDSPDAADSLAMVLRLAGQEVWTAYDGPTALARAREYRPAVVFLDIGMPGMDGHEVARRLRRESGLAGALLVALTGWGQDEDRRRSAEAGFDHHLVKPVEPSAVRQLLADSRASESGRADNSRPTLPRTKEGR